ncbi:MAG: hypothetical protein IJX14_07515, partial [Clostridia bacterium]|nr:hypothetical protein [Clostridia bacterium]
MLQTFLLTMAEINVTISALILLLLLFTRLFGSRYTARCRYILWIVVILRLCIPMGTPFIPALLEIPLPPETEQTETLSDVQNVPEPPENDRVSAAGQPSPIINGSTEQEFFLPEGQSTAEPAQTPSVQEKDSGLRDMLLPILTGLWAVVAFL